MDDKITRESASLGVPVEARREFLQKAGKFAAYTPPTLLALMYPGVHAVASSGGNPGNGNTRPCDTPGNPPFCN